MFGVEFYETCGTEDSRQIEILYQNIWTAQEACNCFCGPSIAPPGRSGFSSEKVSRLFRCTIRIFEHLLCIPNYSCYYKKELTSNCLLFGRRTSVYVCLAQRIGCRESFLATMGGRSHHVQRAKVAQHRQECCVCRRWSNRPS